MLNRKLERLSESELETIEVCLKRLNPMLEKRTQGLKEGDEITERRNALILLLNTTINKLVEIVDTF